MDNKNYLYLTQDDITNINTAQALAQQVGEFIKTMADSSTADHRWLNIAKTDLQKGFMSLIRSIAKPETF